MMTESKFATAAEVLAYMFAGNATFTFRSLRTGTRFTYNVKMADKKNENDVNEKPAFFVKVLSGPDNTSDYTYIGMIHGATFGVTKASRHMANAPSVQTLTWALKTFFANVTEMPAQMEVWHTGRCGRCGRPLTVPESVASGIGPDCAAQMGHGQVVLPLNPSAPAIPVKRTFASAKKDMKAAGGRAIADAMYAPAMEPGRNPDEEREERLYQESYREKTMRPSHLTVDQELDRLVEAKVAEYRNENPEAFYQDGMLDEQEALAVARNKFRKELEQDDRYLGSKFGEMEAQQEAVAYRRMR